MPKKILIPSILLIFMFFWILLYSPFSLVLSYPLRLADYKIYSLLHIGQKDRINEFSTKELCEAGGGRWTGVGLLQIESCYIESEDAGNFCLSGFQCQLGQCIKETPTKLPIGFGHCSPDNTPFGCYASVTFGIVGHYYCTD